jgi:hypothetical protein
LRGWFAPIMTAALKVLGRFVGVDMLDYVIVRR